LILIENSSKGYRNRLEIVKDMLSIIEVAGTRGSKKTHIMYGANLSYKLLKRYLFEVLDAGLIYKYKSFYVITKKGKLFLQAYEDIDKEHREIEKHAVRLNNGKAELHKMLVLPYKQE
jgi:predicted transcriptional regulator